MTYSFTSSESATFTVTHARYLAAKVSTDLKRIQRFYGSPDDQRITNYETEATELLRAGYLGTITYGFQLNGRWIEPTLRYTARNLGGIGGRDDDPGKISPWANISGAIFHSYLTYAPSWHRLTSAEREAFQSQLPFRRSGAPEPAVSGIMMSDRHYSSGGRALERFCVRSRS